MQVLLFSYLFFYIIYIRLIFYVVIVEEIGAIFTVKIVNICLAKQQVVDYLAGENISVIIYIYIFLR